METLIRKCGACGGSYGIVYDKSGHPDMFLCKCQKRDNVIVDIVMFIVCVSLVLISCHFILGRG